MRAILVLSIVLAVAFVCVEMSAAAPGGDVKSSPLFKRSLEESIAKLEGKAPEATGQAEAEPMPTGKPGCPEPDAPETEISTCSPSWCGSSQTCEGTCAGKDVTCSVSCYGTCYEATCSSTCANTCVSTCAGGSCPYHYIWRGLNKWNYNGQVSANWYGLSWHGYSVWWGSNPTTTIKFLGSGAPPSEGTSWLEYDGFYEIDKWYSSAITNIYDIESAVTLRGLPGEYIRFYSVLHSLSPPDATGYYKNVIFYFY